MKTRYMNQDCAEVMLMNAVQLVMGKQIHFQYKNDPVDGQVDLGPAFMFSPDTEKKIWSSGKKKESLEHSLKQLDINKVYFLRTGTNGGAGHWQTLYYDMHQEGWINYSSEVNHYQLTKNDSLTDQGIGLLSPFADWGIANSQYSFLVVEASEQNLIHAANYLHDVRTVGTEKALENAFLPQDTFYNSFKIDSLSKRIKKSQSSESLADSTIDTNTSEKQEEEQEDNVTEQSDSISDSQSEHSNTTDYEEPPENALIDLLDEYLKERRGSIDSHGRVNEYFYGRFFAVFQKSYTEKCNAIVALKAAANGEKVDLLEHLSTLRNGHLGNYLRTFIKAGNADKIVGKEVRTVSDFIRTLDSIATAKNFETEF